MEITIQKIAPGESPQTKSFSRKSTVNSRLVLGIENEQLVYMIVPVEPYERDVPVEDVDYGFDDAGPTIFFAEVEAPREVGATRESPLLAGRIKMFRWWN